MHNVAENSCLYMSENRKIESYEVFVKECDISGTLSSTKKPEPKPGIYIIKNTVSGKLYIGSSKNLRSRFWCYFNKNEIKKHFSLSLQGDVYCFGLDSFEYYALYTEDYQRDEKQMYNTLREERLYNDRVPFIYTWFKGEVLYAIEESGLYKIFHSYEEVYSHFKLEEVTVRAYIKSQKFYLKGGVYFSWYLFKEEELTKMKNKDATLISKKSGKTIKRFRNYEEVCTFYGISKSSVEKSVSQGTVIKRLGVYVSKL